MNGEINLSFPEMDQPLKTRLARHLPLSADFDIKRYREFDPSLYDRIIAEGKSLEGALILHINATPIGGGVAELLASQVQFERSLGIDSRWYVIEASRDFFQVTKKIHNLLQGKSGAFTEEDASVYIQTNQALGASFEEIMRDQNRGVIVVHDPQPLPIVSHIPEGCAKLLRLHIDLSTPNPQMVEVLRPFAARFDRIILSSEAYPASLPWLPLSKTDIIHPAIDPLTEKNRSMNPETARAILEQFGINCTKPIVTQVSRFDPWKDPLGVIQAYYLAKNRLPNLQLILAGVMLANDDPEAAEIFGHVEKHAAGDPDIHLFKRIDELKEVSNDAFVNALYTASDIVLQKSLREGFGLTMTEAMWKGKPIIAGHTAGAAIQIRDGENGILVSSPEEASRAIIDLLENPARALELGKRARESVRKNFLTPRFILDNLLLYQKALERETAEAEPIRI